MAGSGTFVALTSEQAEIFKGINTALGKTNLLLKEQEIHVTAIARLGAMTEPQITKIRKLWEDEMRAAGIAVTSAGGVAKRESKGTTGVITNQAGIQKKNVNEILSDIKKVKTFSVDMADEVGRAASETEFVYKNAAKIFGFLGDATGINYDDINRQAGKYMTTMEGLGKQLHFTAEEYKINGQALEIYAGVGGEGLRNLGEAYTYLANKTTLAMHVTRDMGTEGAIDLFKLTKATEINMEDMRALVERQFSLTGKASSKMVKELVHYSIQLGKNFDVSSKLLRENAIDVIKATKNFGNVTADEAVRIGHSLLEIGISFQELNSVVGKMQGFESAVGVVGDLTTVFGVQLDAMELMRLANEDQGQLLFYLRDAFDAAGMGAENMNLPMKRLLADLLSVGDIEVVERIFSDRAIRSTEDMQRVMKTAGEADLKQAMKDLHADMPLFHSDVKSIKSLIERDFDQVIRVQMGKTLNQSARNLTRFGGKIRSEILDLTAVAVDKLGDGVKNLADVDPAQLGKVGAQLKILAEGVKTGDVTVMAKFIAEINKLGQVDDKKAGRIKSQIDDLKEAMVVFYQTQADILGKATGPQFKADLAKMREIAKDEITVSATELQRLMTEHAPVFQILLPDKYKPQSIPEYLKPVEKGAKIFGVEYRKTMVGDMDMTTSEMNKVLFKGLNNRESIYFKFHKKLQDYQRKNGTKGLKEYAQLIRAQSSLTQEQLDVMLNAGTSTQLDTMKRQRENIKESLTRNKGYGITAFKDLSDHLKGRLKSFGFTEKSITDALTGKPGTTIDALISEMEGRQSARLFGETPPEELGVEAPTSPQVQEQARTTDRHISEIQQSTRKMSTNANTLQREMAALKESMAGFVTAVNKSADVIASHKTFNFKVSGVLSNLIDAIEGEPDTPGKGIKVVTIKPGENTTP